MDLATKKLAFIEEYLRLTNEKIINKLSQVLHSEKEKSQHLTQNEMDAMIEESEEDIKLGNVISHQALKQEVQNWRSSQKR